jgi:hypothetical protein
VSELRFVTVHTNPLAVVHYWLCVKLAHDAQLTAAGRVVATHTPVLCSTVVRNGASGSQAHYPCTTTGSHHTRTVRRGDYSLSQEPAASPLAALLRCSCTPSAAAKCHARVLAASSASSRATRWGCTAAARTAVVASHCSCYVRFCRYRFPATDLNSKATWFGIQ